MNRMIATVIAGLLAVPAFAESHASGDAAAGQKEFNKCKSCHMIVADDGTEIVKGQKTGPNLWGLPGRTAGSYPDFKYGASTVAAGEKGLAWDEASFVEYLADPRAFLRSYLGDDKAKSNMNFKVGDAADAANIWAFIASVSPAPTN